ncbi:hypothetical protein [Glutamicibacter sp. FBE19]|uniref:hypothetical protein n=1 Tax=Glutamicibacter sp. FBE19 TaxID=2761534 RepID=UPI00189672FB|nr:hypothetical protein [Glutamicibacter sp. FBE19]MBF6671576.1 hypothetical protein [Glutamicibacter sp. FBE19]
MSEPTINNINIYGLEVPMIIPEGHMVTGAVVLLTTAGMDEHGTRDGFLCGNSEMPHVQLVGMLRTASLEAEEEALGYGASCACEDCNDD